MSEASLFAGQPVMSQLLSLIPKSLVRELAEKHQADRYYKRFFAYDHLVSMLYTSLRGCESLRELICGMQVNQHRLLHLGLLSTPCRSTLADANARRSEAFFGELFHRLHRLHMGGLPDSYRKNKRMLERLFIVDSTTISLFSEVMHGAGAYRNNGRKKGGAKAHVLMRASDDVPCFVHLTEARVNDRVVLDRLPLPAGSIIVLDKGFNSYAQYDRWEQHQVTYVTRLVENSALRVHHERQVSQHQRRLGVLSDQEVELAQHSNTKVKRIKARVVGFFDAATGREFRFLTNDRSHAPATIAALYKRRWQIELLFKRIKQHRPLRYFLGDSPNAIKIQIWCALIADLLIKVTKDRAELVAPRRWSFSNLAAIVRQHLGTYVDLMAFLKNPERALLNYRPPPPQCHQLSFAYP
ncbi:MAG: IS4 family transposase [Flavobacteriales bacterium]|nr:IS4 family transposase [Flavobacteriales bacterium]